MDIAGVALIDSIRLTVRQSLEQRGCDLSDLHEAILIRQGTYCGRRFECAGGSAIWFIEEQQIKYYDAEGRVLEAVPAPGASPTAVPAIPRRRVA